MCCENYSSPTLTNVIFLENSGIWGGGIRCWRASPILKDVRFLGNTGNWGGGYFGEESSPILANVIFAENNAHWGGGMECDSSFMLINVVFLENSAATGGGLYCTGGSPIIVNCTFSNNYSWSHGGGMECAYSSSPTLIRCTFNNNRSLQGGAVYSRFSTPLFANCTFFGNSTSYKWPCIFSSADSRVRVVSSIIAMNGEGEPVACRTGASVNLTYCNVYGNIGGDWVACIAGQDTMSGNMSCDPMFCFPDTGDFYLAENSCCIGAGCDSLGNPDSTVDIGAFGVGCPPFLPAPFSLLFPPNKAFTPRGVRFDWETANHPNPYDSSMYDLYISTSYRFPPDSTTLDSNLAKSEHAKILDYGIHYWKVRACDRSGGERWSNQTGYFMVTGMHYLSGDFNADGSLNPGDIVYASNYLFRNGLPPVLYEAGDCNCDGVVDPGDVVYLINYLFRGGPPPCEP